MPVTPNSFDSRKKLPEQWCGLRDEKLSAKVGLEGCIFIHATGFIGGHHTKEGALHLAREVSLLLKLCRMNFCLTDSFRRH